MGRRTFRPEPGRAGPEAGIFRPLCSPSDPVHEFRLDLCPPARIKVKKGLHVTAARPTQPTVWTARLDRFKGSKHHTTLITCHRSGPAGPESRWAVFSPQGAEEGGLLGRFMSFQGRGLSCCVHIST